MSNPTPEAVEALDRDLYQHRAAMVMARKDYARAVLTGKVKLSGLYTLAQLDAAVAAERERCEERFEGVYRIAEEIACEGTEDHTDAEIITVNAGRCTVYFTFGEVRAAIAAIREGK